MHTLHYDTGDSISAVALSGDGRVLAGTSGREVILWNSILEEPTVLPHSAKLGQGDVLCVTFTPEGEPVVVYDNGRIGVHSTSVEVHRVPRPLYWWSLHPTAPHLALSTGGKLTIWDMATRQTTSTRTFGGYFNGGQAFDPTRDAIVVANNGAFQFWPLESLDSQTGPMLSIGFNQLYPRAASCSPDGRWLAVAFENWVRVWEIETNILTVEIPVKSQLQFTTVAFHPNGKLITTGSRGLVQLWDPHTWTELSAYAWRIGWTGAFARSPDGTTAAVGGQKGHLAVWDME